MGEVIDLAAYRKRQKFLKYLTEGIELELDYQMLEEFKYHLERYLNNRFQLDVLNNLSKDLMEISTERIEIVTLCFHGSFMEFTLSPQFDHADPKQIGKLRQVSIAILEFWEAFEKEIPMIQQRFL